MAQERSEGGEIWNRDPVYDVKEEILDLKHGDRDEKLPENVQVDDDLNKDDGPAVFVDESMKNSSNTKGAHGSGSPSFPTSHDPLHYLKEEGGSPLVAAAIAQPVLQKEDAAKSEGLHKFEGILSNHSILKDDRGVVASQEVSVEEMDRFGTSVPGTMGRVLPARGAPHFRISAHHGMRPGGPLSRDLKTEEPEMQDRVEHGEKTDFPMADDNVTLPSLGPGRPVTGRGGVPAFRISAHHGMRPGGPLARDLKSESADSGTVEAAIADLSSETKTKSPGLHRGPCRGNASVPRRGGLARTGSGVPGESKGMGSLARMGSGVPGEAKRGGGLARTGSGVPGNSLARSGSGVPGNSLARTGSGISGNALGRSGSEVPSFGANDLKDFASFLDSTDFAPTSDPMVVQGSAASEAVTMECVVGTGGPTNSGNFPILP